MEGESDSPAKSGVERPGARLVNASLLQMDGPHSVGHDSGRSVPPYSSGFPAALGRLAPASFARVGAMSRMSITPRDLWAAMPGPSRKKLDHMSGWVGR